MKSTRPTWAEVSRSKLIGNHDILLGLAGPETELLAVVKANAYGHGMAGCAQALEANGARWFGVTSVEEGTALRRVSPEARIVVMCGVWEGEADAAIEHRLTPVVWETRHLDWLEAAARRQGAGARQVPVHLEVDTGMSRQGADRRALPTLAARLTADSPLRVEALMTHFHSPEDSDETRMQVNEYLGAVAMLRRDQVSFNLMSAGSSAHTLYRSGFETPLADAARWMQARRMLRPGIALYGYSPLPSTPSWLHVRERDGVRDHGIEPVLAWKTRVVSLRETGLGRAVGYGATFRAKRPTRLALLPVGYADGLNRLLSNRGTVLVRGQHAPIAGRISMDHTTVDVTDVAGVEVGDEVALIGEQGGARVTAENLADLTGTIPYEVLCGIAARVPRVMVD